MTRQTRQPDCDNGGRRGFWRNKAGNIALISALVIIPLTVALGMAFDFTLSQTRRDQLDGIADAAVLGAVTPTEMALSCTTAATQSQTLFNGQEVTVAGVTGLSVVMSGCPDTSTANVVTRTITITYTGQSQNVFASLLGMPTLPITGHSTATSSTAPNINFFLLLDTSPSMEIAATTVGITSMEGDTQLEVDGTPGCAFGCHQSNPGDLTSGTCPAHIDPTTRRSTTACQFLTSTNALIHCATSGAYADGTSFTTSSTFPETGRDNYDLSRCLGVTLRIDLLRTAVQNLVTTAAATEQTYNATYQMALYETETNQSNPSNDLNLFALQPMTAVPTSGGGALATAAGNISALEMFQNNNLVSGDSNGDMDTFLNADVNSMNQTSVMPTPGNGAAGNTPQEVLFIVTDGLNDATPTRTYAPLDWNGAICSAIKGRGIRIAVLYTQYFPLTAPGGWYETNVLPALPTGLPTGGVLPASTPVGTDPMALGAQQCASPGLFYEVSTDGDISAALQALFQEAVATARLLH
jgi:Flp pilus assembly protein TadG